MKNPKTYSEDDKAGIAQKLLEYKSKHNISNAKLGKITGLGQYIGYILKGKFEVPSGDTKTPIADSYFALIESFLGEESFVVETMNYKMCKATLLESKRYQEVRVIHGKKGAGKTFSIKNFSRENPEHTFIITCAGDMRQRELIIAIGEAIGVDTSGSPMDIRRAIRKKLENQSYPIIIIDEAENLLPKHYATIKALYDNLEDIAGIVLVGSHKKGKTYWDWLQMMSAKSQGCFPQIVSRFSMYPVALGEMVFADCAKMCAYYNIEGKDQQTRLFNDCKGDYRVLDKLIKRLVRRQEINSLS